MRANSLQSCLTFWDPMDCSLPGSSVHGTFQARILEWVAVPSLRRFSWPRDRTQISCISCTGRWVFYHFTTGQPLPGGASGIKSPCQCRRQGFDPWVEKIPWRGKWLPTPVFLPGKFHGQRSLVGYSPSCHKESDTTEWLSVCTHTQRHTDTHTGLISGWGTKVPHAACLGKKKKLFKIQKSCQSDTTYFYGPFLPKGRKE